MTDHTEFVTRLTRALPRTDLFAAEISGLSFPNVLNERGHKESLNFYEPPFPQRTLYVPIHEALTLLARACGAAEDRARYRAVGYAHHILRATSPHQRCVVSSYFFTGNSQHAVAIESLVQWLRHDPKSLAFFELFNRTQDHCHILADGLERETERIINSPGAFIRFDRTDQTTLATVPAQIDPRYMIQYMPGWPWETEDFVESEFFYAWRDSIIPIANEISNKIGKCVYMFTDPDDTDYDDNGHRYFVAHWLACHMPDDLFVQYLVAASGCASVEQFKEELLKVENFTHPFEVRDCFGDNDEGILGCWFSAETFEVTTN